MLPHISPALTSLSQFCEISENEPRNGWTIDVWELTDSSLASLDAVYKALIEPPELAGVIETLAADGVDLGAILFDAPGADPDNLARVTRADLLELAAAASMVAVERVSISTMVMPNVPKGSRKQSSPGIDILAVQLKKEGNPSQLEEGEFVYIGSVKHSTVGCADVRLDLDQSVSDESLSVAYLGHQLRVMHGALKQRDIDASRGFLDSSFRPNFGLRSYKDYCSRWSRCR